MQLAQQNCQNTPVHAHAASTPQSMYQHSVKLVCEVLCMAHHKGVLSPLLVFVQQNAQNTVASVIIAATVTFVASVNYGT